MTKILERRFVPAQFEVRDNPDGTVGIHGEFATFDVERYSEKIKPSAFNRSLAQRDDIRCLVNHDGVPIARTKSGTMTLGVDTRAGTMDVPVVDMANPTVQELISAMRRGDIDQMSFAGYFTDAPTVDGVREVREVQLVDVSIVTFPWYDTTSVGLTGDRDIDRALVCLRSLTPEQRSKVEAAVADSGSDRAAAFRALRAAPPGKSSYGDLAWAILDAIEAMIEAATGVAPYWVCLDDFGDDWAVYSLYVDSNWDYFQVPYTADAAGVITVGAPFPVEVVTEYRPITEPASGEDRALTPAEARALLGLDPAA